MTAVHNDDTAVNYTGALLAIAQRLGNEAAVKKTDA